MTLQYPIAIIMQDYGSVEEPSMEPCGVLGIMLTRLIDSGPLNTVDMINWEKAIFSYEVARDLAPIECC